MATIVRQENKNGVSWIVRIRRKGQPTLNKSFPSKKEAQAFANEIESSIDKGKKIITTSFRKTLIGSVINEYKELGLIYNPQEGCRLNILEEHIGDWSIGDFTVEIFHKYLTRHDYNKSRAEATVRKNYFTLKKVLEWYAEKSGFDLPHRLFDNRTIKKPSSGNQRERLWTQRDFKYLFIGANKHLYKHKKEFKLILLFLGNTGLRLNECLSLKVSDIDLAKRVVAIHKDISKTNEYRVVPLTTTAKKIAEHLLKHGDYHSSDKLFKMFKNSEQLGLKFRTVLKKVNNGLKHDGLEEIESLHIHDLRHSAITNFYLKSKGMLTDIEISTISGHKDLRTLKRYTHINGSSLVDKLW